LGKLGGCGNDHPAVHPQPPEILPFAMRNCFYCNVISHWPMYTLSNSASM
jgi:hypothetical protein